MNLTLVQIPPKSLNSSPVQFICPQYKKKSSYRFHFGFFHSFKCWILISFYWFLGLIWTLVQGWRWHVPDDFSPVMSPCVADPSPLFGGDTECLCEVTPCDRGVIECNNNNVFHAGIPADFTWTKTAQTPGLTQRLVSESQRETLRKSGVYLRLKNINSERKTCQKQLKIHWGNVWSSFQFLCFYCVYFCFTDLATYLIFDEF